MYCIEFFANQNLTIQFGERTTFSRRGEIMCTEIPPQEFVDKVLELFERYIPHLKLSRSDVSWRRIDEKDHFVYSGLKIKLSDIPEDIITFDHVTEKLNVFIVHLKTTMDMKYTLVGKSYENNIVKIKYVLY